MAWRPDHVGGMHDAEFAGVDHDARERSEYINSPPTKSIDGATEVRENLERDPSLGRKRAIHNDMLGSDLGPDR